MLLVVVLPEVVLDDGVEKSKEDLTQNLDGGVEESKDEEGDKDVLIIEEEEEEEEGEKDDQVPSRPTTLKQFTNLMKSLFVNADANADTKNADTKKGNGDGKATDKSDAKVALAILRTQVENKVKDEVSGHTYNYLRSQCASRKLGGNGSREVLRKRLENCLIDERFKQQLEAFEQQVKTHKTDDDPEDFFDLEETLKDFKDNYVDI